MKKTILFQGDSITDCGRGNGLGGGYPLLVASELGCECPGEYDFINRGISGNRIVDLYARIKRDIINLKPDYMSILIGINDVWHEYGDKNGVDAEKFERIYDMLITEIKTALPDIKIMIFEPFVLPGTATVSDEEHPGRWEYFISETKLRQAAAKRIAQKHNLKLVELHDKLTEANDECPGVWSGDGVHPLPAGHGFIKREWLKAFNEIK